MTLIRSRPASRTRVRPPPSNHRRRRNTRQALLISALQHFSKHGIRGTSIRELTTSAKARNKSALHYYFGSKERLVEELVLMIQDWFDRIRQGPYQEIEKAHTAGRSPQLSRVLEAFIRPYVQIIEQEAWGLDAIRFMAAIEFDQEPMGWEALASKAAPAVRRFLGLIQLSLGAPVTKELKRRIQFYIDSVIQGFATHKHLRASFCGNLEVKSLEDLRGFYIECGLRLLADLGPGGARKSVVKAAPASARGRTAAVRESTVPGPRWC